MKWSRYEDLAEALGVVIRAQREKMNLSQEDVAHEARLSVGHFAKIEGGTQNGTIKSFVAIAHVLKMDFLELTQRAAEIKPPRKR